MIDSLRPLHPRFDDWNWGDGPEIDETEALGGIYPFANIRPDIERAIERNVTIVDGDPEPLEGYFVMLKTDLTKPEGLVHLSVSAGCGDLCISVSPFCNSAEFEIDPTPDLSLLTFSVWRRVMLILAETWEATWAEASPMDIRSEWTGFPVRRAWMNYVSPRLAPLITPPPGVIVERRPNGGLFLAATDETFQTANPKHKAAARTIEAALQPLNTIPIRSTIPTSETRSKPPSAVCRADPGLVPAIHAATGVGTIRRDPPRPGVEARRDACARQEHFQNKTNSYRSGDST